MIEALLELWDVLSRNALRTFLTGLSVAWGVFMLVVLLGAGNGLENGANWEFRDDAQNSIWIGGGKTSIPYQGRSPGRPILFKNQDYKELPLKVPGIEHLTGRYWLWGEFSVTYGAKRSSFNILGVHPDQRYLEKTLITRGRYLDDNDQAEKRKVCVIGSKVREILFGNRDPIGEYVHIRGLAYKVVGEFEDIGGENELRKIYVPISTAQLVYNQPEIIHQLIFTVGDASVEQSQAMAEKARAVLARNHGFAVDDRRALRMGNNLEQYTRITGVFRWIRIFVWVVGVGTLLAGIVGIGNIMLISVAERTKEIGIRKALGATPASIIRMVLGEALVLTGVSGYAGLVAGVGLVELVATRFPDAPFFREPSVSLDIAVSATLLIMGAGALAGFFPAYRAARVNPIVALRSE
ncbi:MAG TPA: ABC transporter permease [Polyangiaceae bacterium]|nr:ABC transporter permease [Polyangiaceae bacterium]